MTYGSPEVWYRDYYARMPCGSRDGIVAKLAHRYIERPFGPATRFDHVLEVGAGSGLHLPFVRHQFERYEMTDISQESLRLAGEGIGDPRVEFAVADAQSLQRADASVDRLVATCVLLHLPQPEKALEEWRRVVRPGGVVSIYVPNEPALITRVGRAITSRRAAIRAGYEGFDLMMAREHINHGWGLDQMVRYVFRNDNLRAGAWPVPRGPMASRVFTVYQATLSSHSRSEG